MAPFSFLTNHGLVLLCIAEDPRVRIRDIARIVDITERAAQRIVADLVATGYVSRARDGRRNTYTVRTDLPVALPADRDVDLNSLLRVLLPGISSDERRDMIEDRKGAHDRRTNAGSRRGKVRSDTRR
jgi:DNA-binding MarR family transcriptional regulator